MEAVAKLYQLNKSETTPTFNSMNTYLEMAMRLEDNDKIVEVIQDFKKQRKKFLNL